jgi:hypothetical protein
MLFSRIPKDAVLEKVIKMLNLLLGDLEMLFAAKTNRISNVEKVAANRRTVVQKQEYDDTELRDELNKEAKARDAADINLQTQIEALHGAIIYIGNINYYTSQITGNTGLLTQWAQANGFYPMKRGYVIIDLNANDWWWNGTEWVNIGYYEIITATNDLKGVVRGNDVDLGVKVMEDGTGRLEVKNLQSKLDGKQNALNRTVTATDNATAAITDTGGNLTVPIPLTVAAPAASSTQTTATASGTPRTLRAQLKILIDNIAYLFSNKQDKLTSGNNIQISGSTISATDTIPNDGTLTIKQDGTSKGTFSANQSGSVEVDIDLSGKAPANASLAATTNTDTTTSTGAVSSASIAAMLQTIWAKIRSVVNALGTKVTANTAITGATKTKITYDSKGLVTAGADLAAADLPSITVAASTANTDAGTAAKTDTLANLFGWIRGGLNYLKQFVAEATNTALGTIKTSDGTSTTSDKRVVTYRWNESTPNGIDLNDYRTDGEYHFYAASGNGAWTNVPPTITNSTTNNINTFHLRVIRQYGSSSITQLVWKRESYEMWIRYSRTIETWGAWQRFATYPNGGTLDAAIIPELAQSKITNLTTDLSGKQPKSTVSYQMGKSDGTWEAMTTAQQNALNSGMASTDKTKLNGIATGATANAKETTAANIKMDGAQAVGSLTTYAAGDHVHPSDTSKMNATPADPNPLAESGIATATGNNLVRRTPNGYVYASYFQQSSSEEDTTDISAGGFFYYVSQATDRFFRKISAAAFRRKLLGAHWNFRNDDPATHYIRASLNDNFFLTNTGMWWVLVPANDPSLPANLTNRNDDAWVGLISIRHEMGGGGGGNKYGEQILIGSASSGNAGRMWTRSQNNGAWTIDWVEKANTSQIPSLPLSIANGGTAASTKYSAASNLFSGQKNLLAIAGVGRDANNSLDSGSQNVGDFISGNKIITAELTTITAGDLNNVNLVNANETRKFLVNNLNYPGGGYIGYAMVEVARTSSDFITQTAFFMTYYNYESAITMRRSYRNNIWSKWAVLGDTSNNIWTSTGTIAFSGGTGDVTAIVNKNVFVRMCEISIIASSLTTSTNYSNWQSSVSIENPITGYGTLRIPLIDTNSQYSNAIVTGINPLTLNILASTYNLMIGKILYAY